MVTLVKLKKSEEMKEAKNKINFAKTFFGCKTEINQYENKILRE